MLIQNVQKNVQTLNPVQVRWGIWPSSIQIDKKTYIITCKWEICPRNALATNMGNSTMTCQHNSIPFIQFISDLDFFRLLTW